MEKDLLSPEDPLVFIFGIFFFFFFFSFSRAAPAAYGGSQARGLIQVVAAGLYQPQP